jgi:hypothetical protein
MSYNMVELAVNMDAKTFTQIGEMAVGEMVEIKLSGVVGVASDLGLEIEKNGITAAVCAEFYAGGVEGECFGEVDLSTSAMGDIVPVSGARSKDLALSIWDRANDRLIAFAPVRMMINPLLGLGDEWPTTH